jgi:NTP pyrophosphatase (non-canonical NTP hydrolase)
MTAKKQNHFDEVVIYWSKDDHCWIAHTIQTDQIGTGDRIVDALADVLKAVASIIEEAERDCTLAIYRDAPDEIKDIAKTAKRLPHEIYEVAHKMVHGDWPKDWNPPEPRDDGNRAFKAELIEC